MAIDVHQCPRCELRFSNSPELRDHLDHDHHTDLDTFNRYGRTVRPAASTREAGRHYLVVANQTLHGEHLIEAVRERAGAGPARFLVLVPATPSAELGPAPPGAPPGGGDPDEVGLAMARWRLRTTIDRLHEAGIDAEGRIGHPDPFTAVRNVVADEDVDEILLSTLPPGASRWLQADLPTRLQRRCQVPVTTLTST